MKRLAWIIVMAALSIAMSGGPADAEAVIMGGCEAEDCNTFLDCDITSCNDCRGPTPMQKVCVFG